LGHLICAGNRIALPEHSWASSPYSETLMNHIVLLGDSIFDNKAYVDGGLDVVAHLRRQIPAEWKATLRAVDGSVVEDVRKQAYDLPDGATHLIVSAGGNNAILNADILQQKAASSAEVLEKLADVAGTFEYHYRGMLQAVLSLKKPTTVCTIYYPRMPEPFVQKIAVAALTVFNDVIIRQAFLAGVPLIDLRLVCNEDADYANEIEPSEAGGGKIADAIVRLVKEHKFESRRTEAFI
ncbi:MAG: SGNH/GDSL hydrolase family protein, partial [Pyrinomonadaceae bacterium]